MTLVERHISQISIIRILFDQYYLFGSDGIDYRPCDRRFARTCSTADANYHTSILTKSFTTKKFNRS